MGLHIRIIKPKMICTQVVEIGPVLVKNISKCCQCTFSIISPWKRSRRFICIATWVSFTQGCSFLSLITIGGPVEKEKTMKRYRRSNRKITDNRQPEKITWAFSSGELQCQSIMQMLRHIENKRHWLNKDMHSANTFKGSYIDLYKPNI